MKALLALLFACSSSSSSPDGPPGQHPDGGSQSPTSGFTIHIGQDYQSSNAVAIHAATQNGVYSGYFQAESDLGSMPNLSVSIVADGGVLSTGSYPCAPSQTEDPFDETSALIHWLDGDTYYTNASTASCTVDVTAASQTSVSAMISGTIYDESQGVTPTDFTASFVATVQ